MWLQHGIILMALGCSNVMLGFPLQGQISFSRFGGA